MKILVTSAITLALAATAGGATTKSGLRGVVLIDPGFPVCRNDLPCTRPAKHVWLFFSRNGQRVGRTQTTDSGTYRITLAPGTYSVTTPIRTTGKGRGLMPQRVSVRRGLYRRVEFRLDIGIQ